MSQDLLKSLHLASLYSSEDIQKVWQEHQNIALINHPNQGWITPNQLRSMGKNKPCPYCASKMVRGKQEYTTTNKKLAFTRNYGYENNDGEIIFNQIGNSYFHPNYVTLDHKKNKARFPELLFDYNNLEIICWKCNALKKDNNLFEISERKHYLNNLISTFNNRYS